MMEIRITKTQCTMCREEIRANWMQGLQEAAEKMGLSKWQDVKLEDRGRIYTQWCETHGAPTVPCVDLFQDYEYHYYCEKHILQMLETIRASNQ